MAQNGKKRQVECAPNYFFRLRLIKCRKRYQFSPNKVVNSQNVERNDNFLKCLYQSL